MSTTTIVLTTVDSAAMVLDQLDPQATSPTFSLDRTGRYFTGLSDGAFYFTSVLENVGAVQSTGIVAFSSTGPVADETMSLANNIITARVAATPGLLEFTRSNTPSVDATNLAALINTHSAFVGIVTASANAGNVTITAVIPGTIGNSIQLSEAMTNTAVTPFSAGTNGTSVTLA